jgi:hypothetical protein
MECSSNIRKEFFEYLDKILDDDSFRIEEEIKSVERARELSKNESKMLGELHKKLYI